MPPIHRLQPTLTRFSLSCSQVSSLSTLRSPSEISSYLSQPTWSVRETLFPSSSSTASDEPAQKITREKLHHLLRLSALPIPASQAEENKLIDDLKRQLQFVQAIQAVDTKGVEPLVAIRDETAQGRKEREIGIDDPVIQRTLDSERSVGRGVVRVKGGVRQDQRQEKPSGEGRNESEVGKKGGMNTARDDKEHEEEWDPLERAGRRQGRYIAVETAKD